MNSIERHEARYKKRLESRMTKKIENISKYNTFENVTNPENLLNAFNKAQKGVSWKSSVQRYGLNRLSNISNAIDKLDKGEDVRDGFVEFDISERGKTRHIKSVSINERVIQKCLCDNVLVPILSKSLIYDNGASLKNKGFDFSIFRFKQHLRKYYSKNNSSNSGYILCMDYSKYFDGIIQSILIKNANQYISDIKTMKLLSDFITAFSDNDVSIGLGSQVSQIGALFYPNKIDHFIKEKLRCKFYGRYMDDSYIIHENKEFLQFCLNEIKKECLKLGIVIHEKKTKILNLKDNFVFLKGKFVLTDKGKVLQFPSKQSIVRIKRKLRKYKILLENGKMLLSDIQNSYNSWRGSFIRRFDAHRILTFIDDYFHKLFFYNL
ncbi:hypothetical protein AGMMS49579_22910 [Spirochaetia bacterium]|nr:hypothetical protein AGMMS49579_22910 [Spirochaetia bacterium]